MKILPTHGSLYILLYWLLGIGIILALFFPYLIAFSFKAHNFLLVLVVLFIFTPWANRRIPLDTSLAVAKLAPGKISPARNKFARTTTQGEHPGSPLGIPHQVNGFEQSSKRLMDNTNSTLKRLSFIKCLGITLLLQVALFFAFYTFSHLTAFTLPMGTEPLPLFQITLPILLLQWGIFPWGIYILLAASLIYTGYIKQQSGDMSTLLRPILRNAVGSSMSLTIDVAAKIAISFSLACTLALIAMECMGLIRRFFNFPFAYGPRLDIFLTILVVFQWSKSNFIEKQLERLLRRVSVPLIIAIFLLCMIISLLGIGFLMAWLSPIFTPMLSITLGFAPKDWAIVWVIFSGIWWLGWTPLVAATLAYVWRGYKIHTLMIGTLLLPITISIFEYLYPNWYVSFMLNESLWNLFPALISAGIIVGLFLRAKVISYAWKATLPISWDDYQRSSKTFLKRLLQSVIIIMGLYWIGGIYISGLIYFAAMFPITPLTLIAGLGLFIVMFTKNTNNSVK